MKKKYILFRNFTILTFIAVSSAMLLNCSAEEKAAPKQNPIIPDLQLINLTGPADNGVIAIAAAGNNFQYSPAKDVKHMILFVCQPAGCAALATAGSKVDLTKVSAGNSTAKSMGMSTTPMSDTTMISGGAFTNNYSTSGYHEWFIIGYDEGGNLIASSAAWKINVSAW